MLLIGLDAAASQMAMLSQPKSGQAMPNQQGS